jgi:hypothetical protein
MSINTDTRALLDRQIDDLLLDIRGFAIVRDLLIKRGATQEEIDSHARALSRARARLAELIRGPGQGGSAVARRPLVLSLCS